MIQHVSIEVTRAQVEPCVAFYELLGFRRVEPPETLRERATWVERDRDQVHLMLADEPVVPPNGHFALDVGEDAYEPTLSALRDAGFNPEPRKQHWGAPRAFVRDPSGHRVELMARSPTRS